MFGKFRQRLTRGFRTIGGLSMIIGITTIVPHGVATSGYILTAAAATLIYAIARRPAGTLMLLLQARIVSRYLTIAQSPAELIALLRELHKTHGLLEQAEAVDRGSK